MAEYLPLSEDSDNFTHTTSGAVTGGQVLVVSGDQTVAASSAASAAVVGVALFDAASGARVTVSRAPTQLLIASGAITAGQTLEAAAGGAVAAHTNGTNDVNIVGVALSTASNGANVRVLWTK